MKPSTFSLFLFIYLFILFYLFIIIFLDENFEKRFDNFFFLDHISVWHCSFQAILFIYLFFITSQMILLIFLSFFLFL